MTIKIPFSKNPIELKSPIELKRLPDYQVQGLHSAGISTIGQGRPSTPISVAETIKLQQKAFEQKHPDISRSPVRIPFTKGGKLPLGLKDPFTKGEFLTVSKTNVLTPLLAGFAEGTLEAIPGIIKSAFQAPQAIGMKKLPRPTDETRIESPLEIGGAVADLLQTKGVSPANAEIIGGTLGLGVGILDAWFTRFVGRSFTRGILRNVAVPDEVHQMAWQKLGKEKTKEEALKTANNLLKEVSPNSGRAVQQGTVDEVLAKDIAAARDIILEKGVPVKPAFSAQKIRDFARVLEADIGDLARRGLGSEINIPFARPAGLLPGTRPLGGQPQVRFGLSTEPIEPVGRDVVRKADPLTTQAKTMSKEEFVKGQGKYFHGTSEKIEGKLGDKTKGIWLAEDESVASKYIGGGIIGSKGEIYYVKPISELKIKDIYQKGDFSNFGELTDKLETKLIKEGYDGIRLNDSVRFEKDMGSGAFWDKKYHTSVRIFGTSKNKLQPVSKSQLEAIWEGAQKKTILAKPDISQTPQQLKQKYSFDESITQQEAREQVLRERAMRELDEVLELDPKFLERANITEESLYKLQVSLEIAEDAMLNNPARQLARFANKSGELPEVLGKGGKFAKKGDDISSELGFEYSEDAREAYQLYKVQKKELNDLRQEIRQGVADLKADKKVTSEIFKREQKRIDELISRIPTQSTTSGAETKRIIRKTTGQEKADIKELNTRIKDLARGAREGSLFKREDILKAGDELKMTLKKLEVSPEDMKWFTDVFKNLRGLDDFAEKLPSIIVRAERLANAREIRNLKTQIINEIKTAQPKIGQKKAMESKFGVEAQKNLNFLRGATQEKGLVGLLDKTSRITEKGNVRRGVDGNYEKAQTEIENLINQSGTTKDGVTPEMPIETTRQIALLNMVGIKDMPIEQLRTTLANIRTLKEDGQLRTLIQQSNKTAELEMVMDTAKIEMRPPKTAPMVLGESTQEINPILMVWNALDNALLGIEQILEKATYGKFTVSEWADDLVRTARGGHARLSVEWNNSKVREFKNIFGEEKLGKINKGLGKREVVFKGKDSANNLVKMELSQFEAAYWYALAKDPTNLVIFTRNMNFTPTMFKSLNDFIKPEMKKYVEFLQDDWLKKIRERTNERYVSKFGMDMPDNPNYMSRLYSDKPVEEEITNLLVGEAFSSHPSTVPSGVKARIGSKSSFRRISIESVMRRHQEQMNQFIHFDEAISDLRRVFNDQGVRETILSQKGGNQLFSTLTKKIDDIARGGMATQMKLAVIDHLIGSFTKASLMAPNFVPFFKQLTSSPAFTLGREGLAYTEWISGSLAYFKNPVEWTKKLSHSDLIFQRLTKGFNRETALAFRRGDKDFTIKEIDMSLGEFLKQGAIVPSRGGDMVPILPGMTAKYIQVTKKLQKAGGMTAEQIHQAALRRAERLASRTQQDPNIESMGRIQTANSMGKAISMYATTPIQYHREAIGVIRMWNRGQISTKDLMRTIITAWVILPQFFQWISDGGEWNEERQLRALMLGPWNYYPAAGNLIGTMYDAFAKGETWKSVASGISPLFAIPEGVQRVSKDAGKVILGDGDMKDLRRLAENLYKVIALTTGKLPSEAPRTADGIIDLINQDTKDPRRLFFSEYALDVERKTGETSVGGIDFGFGGNKLQGIKPIDFGF